jgi:hypothetical protein
MPNVLLLAVGLHLENVRPLSSQMNEEKDAVSVTHSQTTTPSLPLKVVRAKQTRAILLPQRLPLHLQHRPLPLLHLKQRLPALNSSPALVPRMPTAHLRAVDSSLESVLVL